MKTYKAGLLYSFTMAGIQRSGFTSREWAWPGGIPPLLPACPRPVLPCMAPASGHTDLPRPQHTPLFSTSQRQVISSSMSTAFQWHASTVRWSKNSAAHNTKSYCFFPWRRQFVSNHCLLPGWDLFITGTRISFGQPANLWDCNQLKGKGCGGEGDFKLNVTASVTSWGRWEDKHLEQLVLTF